MNKYIITVLGKDRPGIIYSVSNSLYELNCNVENANQMILQNEFAGFFIAEPPEEFTADSLKETMDNQLEGQGLQIHVNTLETGGNSVDPESGKGEIFIISTIGPDRKGLVARISGIISSFGANILNLKAVFKGGDEPVDNIMSYEVRITPDIDRKSMFSALKQKAASLDLDIRIQHKNIFNTINRI
ncbi:MAG: ACT domain-containing protein [Desulfobacteraceae bacterium]